MKAVGARNSHIKLIFLVEGALIGTVGGIVGTVCGWTVARAGIRFTVMRQRKRLRGPDGEPRVFRTRDAAARVARELNRRGK